MVRPWATDAWVARSSSGSQRVSSTAVPFTCRLARASRITPRLRFPRRSILTRPASSAASFSHWMTGTPFGARSTATYSSIGRGVMTTPPGCTERYRGVPMSRWACARISGQGGGNSTLFSSGCILSPASKSALVSSARRRFNARQEIFWSQQWEASRQS